MEPAGFLHMAGAAHMFPASDLKSSHGEPVRLPNGRSGAHFPPATRQAAMEKPEAHTSPKK